MVRFTEFSVVAEDDAHLRIRKIWPVDTESPDPPVYEVIGEESAVVEALPNGKYRVNGKVYTTVAQD